MLPVLALVSACLNGVYINTDEGTKLIARAESALADKQYKKVIGLLVQPDTFFTDQQLDSVRRELVAIAKVRLGRFEEALPVLSRLAAARPKSPRTQARYAEAMFATGDRWMRWNARDILERLEQKDLMPDAESWAVLAEIRRVEKDDAAFKRASERCKQIAKDASGCPQLSS